MSYVRGADPIWWIPNLTGSPTDDTYFMFVLSNVIPYLPSPVYQNYQGTIPWSNPIEVLSNGTLPVDIFFDSTKVYRLEIRAGNTQDAQLIYLVENYSPEGTGGVTPVEGWNDTTNQITNPQFALVDFPSPSPQSLTSTAATIDIAPGWQIVTTGSAGSITVSQVPLNGASGDTTNPPYMLNIASSGWTTVGIKQTFAGNGALWTGEGVAVAFSAASTTSSLPAQAFISYSDGTTQTIFSTTLNALLQEKTGSAIIEESSSTDVPPNASTALTISWTAGSTVSITSIQLVGQDAVDVGAVAYQQETIQRQIDQTFHVYADSLITMPKDSLLTGWDFGQNPWQFTTTTSTNVATNRYTADQTVVIQQAYVTSATGNNVAVGQAPAADNFGFQMTAVAANNQSALVQYIDTATMRPYWKRPVSSLVKVRFNSSHATAIKLKMRLIWRTTAPSTIGQNEPVLSWTGDDPVFAAGWTAITPNNDPAYTLQNASDISELAFEGMTLPAASTSTMYLAVVLYTVGPMNAAATADYLVVNDVSLVPNEFATSSTSLSYDETLGRCHYYYESSYDYGDLPGTVTQSGSLNRNMTTSKNAGIISCIAQSFDVTYKQVKRIKCTPILYPTLASGVNGASVLLYADGAFIATNTVVPISGIWISSTATNNAYYQCNSSTGLVAQASASIAFNSAANFHYTIDARIGI